MEVRDEIIKLIQDCSGSKNVIGKGESISEEYGIVMDDFHELIEDYAREFGIDMTDYLWYFHAEEEGVNWGRCFFKAPYDRVKRIQVTPIMLEEFARIGKWSVDYPEHSLPKYRHDIMINMVVAYSLFFIISLTLAMKIVIWMMPGWNA